MEGKGLPRGSHSLFCYLGVVSTQAIHTTILSLDLPFHRVGMISCWDDYRAVPC